jgi:hypothetical protein
MRNKLMKSLNKCKNVKKSKFNLWKNINKILKMKMQLNKYKTNSIKNLHN